MLRLRRRHRHNEEANLKVLAEIRAALAKKYLRPANDGPIVIHPDDARRVLKREHIRSLLSHFPWYRESDRDQVWNQMALIICILVATDWLEWVQFKDYFYTVGRDLLYPKFDDSNLPLDDATEPFLPEALWTNFLRDQYIFTPIFIYEDSHEKIYSAKFRLPILESTLLDEEGAQGKVYKVHVDGRFVKYGGGRINTNVQLMAMKRIAAKKQRDFRAETKALTHFTRCLLQSRNIMKSITSFVLGTDFVILSPWAEGRDLHQFLYCPDKVFPNFPELSRRFSPNNLLTEALSLAQALEFLHNQMTTDRGRKLRCAHLDLKPENILVCFPPDAHPDSCPVGQWKITDFGMAKVEQSVVGQEIVQEHQEQDPAPGNVLRDLSSQPPKRGEGAFQPPEVQTRDKAKVSTRRDVWSFGCVLAMVLAYALGGPEEVAKQRQSRATGSDDFFYLRRRQPRGEPRLSAPTLHRVPAEIKPNIQKWLENAPAMRNAIHAEWIGACCQLVLSLLNVDVVQRPEIFTAIFHLGRIISHTEVHARERMWEFGDASTAPEVVPTTIPQLAVRRSSNDSVSEINAEFMGVKSIAATSSAQSPQKGAPSSASFTSFWKADDTISFLNLELPNKEVRVTKACLAPSGSWAALYSPTTVFTYDLKRLGDDPAVWTARPSNSSLPTQQQRLTSMQVIKGSQQSSIEQVFIRGKFLALVERTEKPSPSWSTRLFAKQNGKYVSYRGIRLAQKPEEIRFPTRGRLAVKYTSYMHLYIPGQNDPVTIESTGKHMLSSAFSGDGLYFCLWEKDKEMQIKKEGVCHYWTVWDANERTVGETMCHAVEPYTYESSSPDVHLIPFHNYPRFIACDSHNQFYLVAADGHPKRVVHLGYSANVRLGMALPDDDGYILIRASQHGRQKAERFVLTSLSGMPSWVPYACGDVYKDIDKKCHGYAICNHRETRAPVLLSLTADGRLARKLL